MQTQSQSSGDMLALMSIEKFQSHLHTFLYISHASDCEGACLHVDNQLLSQMRAIVEWAIGFAIAMYCQS